MKISSLIAILVLVAFAAAAKAQSGAEATLLAERTAPLNEQYDKWRAEWGERHLFRRNDPDVVVMNFFRLGSFDIAERKMSGPLGDKVSFGFDKIGPCRYQSVTLERMTKPTSDIRAKRWVSRFTETIDLNNVNWKGVRISNLLASTTLELNNKQTAAYQYKDENFSGWGKYEFPKDPTAYETERKTKDGPENVLLFGANIDFDRMEKAAQILMKECPGRSSPF